MISAWRKMVRPMGGPVPQWMVMRSGFERYGSYRYTSSEGGGGSIWQRIRSDFQKALKENKEVQESLKELEKTGAQEKITQTMESTISGASQFGSVAKSKTDEVAAKTREKLFNSEAAKGFAEQASKSGQALGAGMDQLVNMSARLWVKVSENSGVQRLAGSIRAAESWINQRKESLPLLGKGDDDLTKQVREKVGSHVDQLSKGVFESGVYKSASESTSRLKEKILDSDNPVVQKSVDMYYTGRKMVKIRETPQSRVLTFLSALDPTLYHQDKVRDKLLHFLPGYMNAFLKQDLESLQAMMPGPFFEVMKQQIEASGEGLSTAESSFLELEDLDIVQFAFDDRSEMDNMAALVVRLQGQYIHCIRDAKGELIEGGPESIHQGVWMVIVTPQAIDDPDAIPEDSKPASKSNPFSDPEDLDNAEHSTPKKLVWLVSSVNSLEALPLVV